MRDVAWDGAWSFGVSENASDHSCNVDDEPWVD